MTEMMTYVVGVYDAPRLVSFVLGIISVCAIFTSLVTEGLKSIPAIDKKPTKLVVYLVAVMLTTPVVCATLAYLKHPIEWFTVFASFLASFVVAKVSMNGWDDVTELSKRLFKKG